MPQSSTLTFRLAPRIKARLESLAKSTERSKAYLAGKALEEYLNVQEWQIESIREAVAAADSPSAVFVSHETLKQKYGRLARQRPGKKGK